MRLIAGLRQALRQDTRACCRSSCSSSAYSRSREPARIPGAVDAEPKPDRIDFLTHQAASSSRSRTTIVSWLNAFSILAAAAAGAGVKALHHQARADDGLGDVEPVDVELMVVLGIGDRRTPAPSCTSCAMRRREKVELGHGGAGAGLPRISPATQVELARARRGSSRDGGLGLRRRRAAAVVLSCSSPYAPLRFLVRPHGRGRSGSARTRRTCGRSCSRSRAPA